MAQSTNQLSVKIYSYLHELYELRKWSSVWISTSVLKGETMRLSLSCRYYRKGVYTKAEQDWVLRPSQPSDLFFVQIVKFVS